MNTKKMLLALFVLAVGLANVAYADVVVKEVISYPSKCIMVGDTMMCLGGSGMFDTTYEVLYPYDKDIVSESSTSTSASEQGTIRDTTINNINTDTAYSDAIIDIGGVIPLGPVESNGEVLSPFKVITKPSTWYGTKTEALQWLYEQSELLNP